MATDAKRVVELTQEVDLLTKRVADLETMLNIIYGTKYPLPRKVEHAQQ